jgi:excisionase family DNA binding protein
LHQELTGLKEELLHAIRASRLHSSPTPQTDTTRLLSVLEVAERVGSTPATIREWIKSGYLPAVALGPAGRKYGLRWGDVEASLAQRKNREISVDADAEASQILASARARATRRRGA